LATMPIKPICDTPITTPIVAANHFIGVMIKDYICLYLDTKKEGG